MAEKAEINFYNPGGSTAVAEKPSRQAAGSAQPPKSGTISWTASEYIEHDRNASWYLALAGLTAIVAALVYLIARDFIAVGVIVMLGVIVGLFAKRRPQQITYELNESSVKIGVKSYAYGNFKSFAVLHDEAMPSIHLEPLKRFMPPLSIFFAPQDAEQITSLLSAHLPYQDQQLDRIERLTRLLKF